MRNLAGILFLSSCLIISSISPCNNKDALESLFSQLDKLLLDCSYENYDCHTAVRELNFVREIACLFYDSCRDCKKHMRRDYSYLIHLIRDQYTENMKL